MTTWFGDRVLALVGRDGLIEAIDITGELDTILFKNNAIEQPFRILTLISQFRGLTPIKQILPLSDFRQPNGRIGRLVAMVGTHKLFLYGVTADVPTQQFILLDQAETSSELLSANTGVSKGTILVKTTSDGELAFRISPDYQLIPLQ